MKHFVTLLHYDENRDVFLEKCLRPTPFAVMEYLITAVPKLIEWRWGQVLVIINKLLKMRSVLTSCYNADKFTFKQRSGEEAEQPEQLVDGAAVPGVEGPVDDERNKPAREGRLDAKKLGEYVTSELWWSLALMLSLVNTSLDKLGSWAEGCKCHEMLYTFTKEAAAAFASARKGLDLSSGDGRSFTCPLAGLRAACLAAGEWIQAFQVLFRLCLEELLSNVALAASEIVTLLDELNRVKAAIYSELEMKLEFWSKLPWALALLAHDDEDLARRLLRPVVARFDASPADRLRHHRITLEILTGPDGRHLTCRQNNSEHNCNWNRRNNSNNNICMHMLMVVVVLVVVAVVAVMFVVDVRACYSLCHQDQSGRNLMHF